MLDETGWKLSTTRAAALVASLLRSAVADSSTDMLLDWLKAAAPNDNAIDELESVCRRNEIRRSSQLDRASLRPDVAALWAAASSALTLLQQGRKRSLAFWLEALTGALDTFGTMTVLRGDDAGSQVLASLRLDGPAAHPAAWTSTLQHTPR